jgi:hypothetical protein
MEAPDEYKFTEPPPLVIPTFVGQKRKPEFKLENHEEELKREKVEIKSTKSVQRFVP